MVNGEIAIDLIPSIFVSITIFLSIITYIIMRYYLKKNYSFMFITMIVCYVMLVIKYLFFPIPIFTEELNAHFWETFKADSYFFHLNLTDSLNYIYYTLIDNPILIIKSIIIMIPLGILIHYAFSKQSLFKQIFIGLGIMLSIETIQIIINYIIHYRQFVFDLSDLILYMSGFIIGMSIWAIIKRIPYLYQWILSNIIFIEKRQEH